MPQTSCCDAFSKNFGKRTLLSLLTQPKAFVLQEFTTAGRACCEGGDAAGWVGGLGAFGGFVLPPVMAFAVHNLGTAGYAIGFVTFVFLTLFSLSMAWILKYAQEGPGVPQTQQAQTHPMQEASAPAVMEQRR